MRRVVTNVVRSGQPRPYADTEHVVQLIFETFNGKDWELQSVTEEYARDIAAGLKCGYIGRKKNEAGFFCTYLEYFRRVDETGAVWQFKTVSPYTD